MNTTDSIVYPVWPEKEYLVGINYFAGWWRPQPNKYIVNGRDWRADYPGRIALLGCYNDQETMMQKAAGPLPLRKGRDCPSTLLAVILLPILLSEIPVQHRSGGA